MALGALTELPQCIGVVGHGLLAASRSLKSAGEQFASNPPGAKASVSLATEVLTLTHGTLDAGQSALRDDLGTALQDLRHAQFMLGNAPDHCVQAVVRRAANTLEPHLPARGAGDANSFTCAALTDLTTAAKRTIAERAPVAPATDRAVERWAEDPVGYPVSAGGVFARRAQPGYGLDDPAKADEIARSVRGSLAEVYGPMVRDVKHNLGGLSVRGIDEIPLAGSAPKVIAQKPGQHADKFLTQIHLTGSDPRLRPVNGHVQSTQFDTSGAHGNGRDIEVPIGDYGEELSRALATAGRAVNEVMLDTLATRHQAVEATNHKLLQDWTFQGPSVISTMLEGQASTVAMLGTLASARVPGHTASEVLDAIIAGRLLDEVRHLPSGITGGFQRSGKVPSNPIVIEDGRAYFSEEFSTIIDDVKRGRAQGRHPAAATGLGCPVGHFGEETVELTKRLLREQERAGG